MMIIRCRSVIRCASRPHAGTHSRRLVLFFYRIVYHVVMKRLTGSLSLHRRFLLPVTMGGFLLLALGASWGVEMVQNQTSPLRAVTFGPALSLSPRNIPTAGAPAGRVLAQKALSVQVQGHRRMIVYFLRPLAANSKNASVQQASLRLYDKLVQGDGRPVRFISIRWLYGPQVIYTFQGAWRNGFVFLAATSHGTKLKSIGYFGQSPPLPADNANFHRIVATLRNSR